MASAVLQARFASFTEDMDTEATRVWSPDGSGVQDPTMDTSTIELIDLGDDSEPMLTMDGYGYPHLEIISF